MPRVPRGLHSPAGAYAPGRLGWGPASPRPAGRIPQQFYQQRVSGIPLVGGQGQTTVSSSTTTGTPIKLVQSQILSNALSGSFAAPTTAGNCVIVVVAAFSNSGTPSVSGVTLGGSADNFASAASVANTPTTPLLLSTTWCDPNCAGGQTAIVVSGANLSVSVDTGIIIMEWSGLKTSSVVDQTSTGSSNSSAVWSSGATSATTQAYELWVGANINNNVGTQPGAPWTLLAFGGGIGLGYQIVTAKTTATFSGSQSPAAQYAASVITLFGVSAAAPVTHGGGLATISVGPQGIGNVWYPASATILTTSGVNDFSTCSIYLGPAGVPITLQATVFPGGYGTASLAIPSMTPGQYIIAQWTGAHGGDIASLNVVGTMDSVMPA